jgi:microcystin-dependent protein
MWPARHIDAGSGSTPVEQVYKEAPTLDATFNSAQLAHTGGSQPHENVQPYLALNYIIALAGTYPSRS